MTIEIDSACMATWRLGLESMSVKTPRGCI